MQNRTQSVSVKISDKVEQFLKSYRFIFLQLGTFLCGYFMGSAFIFESISPFGVAYIAAVQPQYVLFSALGSVMGYLFTPYSDFSMKYIGALVLIVMIRLVFNSFNILKNRLMSAPLLAGAALLITSGAVTLAIGFTMENTLTTLSEVLLASGSAYFLVRSLAFLESGQKLTKPDAVSLVISFSVIIIALAHVVVFSISLGRVVAIVAILLMATTLGESGGAITGIVAGITISLLGSGYGFFVAAYALSGLVAALVFNSNKLVASVAFVVTNIIVSISAPTSELMLASVYEAFLASVIFIALPDGIMDRLKLKSASHKEGLSDDFFKHIIFKKLELFKEGLGSIHFTTKEVGEKLNEINRGEISDIHSNVAESVCKSCRKNLNCWRINYSGVMNDINDMIDIIKQSGRINKFNAPTHFVDYCEKPESFLYTLQGEYNEYLRKQNSRRRVAQVRSVVSDQFEGFASMVQNLEENIGKIRKESKKQAAQLHDYLSAMGLEPEYCCCYEDENDRMTAEAVINRIKFARMDKAEATLAVSEICQRIFSEPTTQNYGDKLLVSFNEKANYTMECGSCQITEEGSKVSGDRYETLYELGGHNIVMLSDGMGSGGSAAVDAALTTSLITNLLQTGVEFDTCLKMANAALLVKAGDESLATIDITDIDLYSGRAQFYKAGAAPTFFVKNGKAGYIESTSLPAGILRGIAFEEFALSFREEDVIIMVSDGVTASGVEWLSSEITAHMQKNVDEIAKSIALTAHERQVSGREDDITVVAIRLKKGA